MDINQRIESIRQQYGPWTAHNIEIAPGIFTIKAGTFDRAYRRAQLYAGLSRRFARRRLSKMRVLDLGCLEGGISLFFAQQGSKCVGIDVRDNHLVKASFAARELGLDRRCTWIAGDINDPSLWKRLGKFELVICSGLFYHLDGHELLPLLRHIYSACHFDGLAIIDTNIAPAPSECIKVDGQTPLWGCHWKEHDQDDDDQKRIAAAWSSWRNNKAFWLTERSLVNAIVTAGFGSVFKPLYPYHEWGHQTRDVWVALTGPADPHGLPLRVDPDPRPWSHPGLQ